MQAVKLRVDRDTRREAILDIAQGVFLEQGYANASMSMIADRVGGSKATLYTYFKSKEELFTAYVERHSNWQRQSVLEARVDGDDIRATLVALGRACVSIVLSDFSIANFRLIVAEAERNPAFGQAYHANGPQLGVALLAGVLQTAADQGQLRLDDATLAANQLVGLCQNRLLKARLCNAMAEPTPEQVDADVVPAVEFFLRVYGPAA